MSTEVECWRHLHYIWRAKGSSLAPCKAMYGLRRWSRLSQSNNAQLCMLRNMHCHQCHWTCWGMTFLSTPILLRRGCAAAVPKATTLPRARTVGASSSKSLAREPPPKSAAAVEFLHQVVVEHERPSARREPAKRKFTCLGQRTLLYVLRTFGLRVCSRPLHTMYKSIHHRKVVW